MFDTLSGKLQRIFKNLRGEGKLTAANMEEALREIRVALLEADVHFKVVKQFIEQVKEKALGEEVLTALSPAQQVVKVVRDELTKMLGSHTSRLRFANEPPTVVLIVGLQGSGKTTSAAKLARFLAKKAASRSLFRWTSIARPRAISSAFSPRMLRTPIYEGTAGRNQAARTRQVRAPRSDADGPRHLAWSIPPGGSISTTSSCRN